MTFSVEPAALDAFAAQVGRAGDDATSIQNYLLGYQVDSGWDGLLIEAVGDSHIRSMNAARDISGRVAGVLHGSQAALTAVADYYRHTDAAAAAKLDATMPGRCASVPSALEQRWAANACRPGFADSREPAGRLKPVDDVEYTHPLAALDNISVSNWALKGFDFVFGFNPLEKVSEFFIGDWQAVAKGGKALGNTAAGFDDLAYNVQGGAMAVHRVWQGAAADAAYAHFTGTATAAESLVDPLKQIAAQFDTIAHGVWGTAEAVTGWVKGMIDAAIIAGIAAAAGTITAESGIGAIVGYGVAAIEVCELLDMWAQATAAMTNLYSIVQGALGTIESQLAFLREAQLPSTSVFDPYQSPFPTR
ncbi:hypothetical protein [Paractinoplanes toevensis]|uniref:WXG100 family type VII secretion target n=1 Tax=Paractinoplanes toevensis TaxID=571911 RepID=A0A919WDQ7_9ACTN|nr:hypothetical protein [Actinoplanes toevensis]GIM98231.1 hypothetical protein Ato02nite_100240 [Actinoplanes toevensis]